MFSENFQHDRLGKKFPLCDYLGQNWQKHVFWAISLFRNTNSLPNGKISVNALSIYVPPHSELRWAAWNVPWDVPDHIQVSIEAPLDFPWFIATNPYTPTRIIQHYVA